MVGARIINGTAEELKEKIKEFISKGYVCDNMHMFGTDPFDAVKNGGSLLVCDGDDIVENCHISELNFTVWNSIKSYQESYSCMEMRHCNCACEKRPFIP